MGISIIPSMLLVKHGMHGLHGQRILQTKTIPKNHHATV